MAETTLTPWMGQLRLEISDHLGWGRASGNWDGDMSNRLQQILNAGLRQFYFGEYAWSFLRDNQTIPTWTSVTGTISARTATTISSTDRSTAFHSSMVGHVITATVSGSTYTITEINSTTQVTVDADPTGEAVGAAFTLPWADYYTLRDDFGEIEGDITFAAGSTDRALMKVSEGQMRVYRQVTNSGYPMFYSIRPLSFAVGTGQRYALEMYPEPSSVWTLTYRQRVLPETMTTTSNFHRGGVTHSETVLLSCFAIADTRYNEGMAAQSMELYQRALQGSIQRDTNLLAPSNLGYNGDDSDRPTGRRMRNVRGNTSTYIG